MSNTRNSQGENDRRPAVEESTRRPPAARVPEKPQGNGKPNGISIDPAYGRVASSIPICDPTWFLDPWIPGGAFSLVVGNPSTGKSTFGAWILSKARRPAIMPGFEEDLAKALLPRLRVNEVDLASCLMLDGKPWVFPYDRETLVKILTDNRVDLLWIDPIDSYIGDTQENDGQGVRTCLESLAKLAQDAQCAVVAARHPGKQFDNICPGSRQWRAVPRELIELRHDRGPPEKRFMRLRKDPFSRGTKARGFILFGEERKPKVLSLEEEIPESIAETLGVGDSIDRWKVDQAVELLKAVLKEGEQESCYVYSCAENERISDRTICRAGQRLGVIYRREGSGKSHRCIWSLPPTPATPATPESDTLLECNTPLGGVSLSDGGSGGSES